MVKTEHLKMEDYFMQIYDSHRQDYLKMAEALFFINRDFFFNVAKKSKKKKNIGGDAEGTLLTKAIAFSNLGDMY